MRVTIVADDSAVIVDGVRHKVDLSGLPADFHALQWDGAIGELEHKMLHCEHCGIRGKKPNEPVSDFAPYQKHLDAWHVADAAAAEALKKQAEDAAHAAGPES